MPRRRLPNPEEYGRRLAEAKRREEKKRHEAARRTDTVFSQALKALDEQQQLLAKVSEELAALPKEVVAPKDLQQGMSQLLDHLSALQLAVTNLDLDTPVPAPTWSESVSAQLEKILELVAAAPLPMPPMPQSSVPLAAPAPLPETIFAGPVTIKVTERDSNGDISDVRVEPTRH